MFTAIAIIAAFVFPFLEAWKDIWMWRDYGRESGSDASYPNAKSRWHLNDALRQALFLVLVGSLYYAGQENASGAVYFVLYAGFWFWLVNDALINAYGLGVDIDYIGTTATIDKLLRKLFGANAGWLLIIIKLAGAIFFSIVAAIERI